MKSSHESISYGPPTDRLRVPVFTGYKRPTYAELTERVDLTNPNTLLGLSFADLAAFFRRQAGLSQEGLARRAGVIKNTINDTECSNTRPSEETVGYYQRGLGLSADDLRLQRLREQCEREQKSERPVFTSPYKREQAREKSGEIPIFPDQLTDRELLKRIKPEDPSTLVGIKFADRARYLRLRAGFTRGQLATAIGQSKSTVGRVEKGETAPRISAVRFYQYGLNLPPDDPGLLRLHEAYVAEKPSRKPSSGF